MSEIADILAHHSRGEITSSALPRLTIVSSKEPTPPLPVIFSPHFCVVAKGRKRLFLGTETYHYDATSFLVTSADLPLSGQVVEAPYLGFALALDAGLLATVLLEMPPGLDSKNNYHRALAKGIAVTQLEGDLLDPVLRFLRLLDQPKHIPILAPLIEREILYRLLLGPSGEMLRQLALPASQLSQIRRAISCIQTRYNEPLRIEELARLAGMSAPSFHRHFLAITRLSPLQYQKRIRLQAARRMLLSQKTDAASVGFDVGYESPSQFSREYRRLFGAPPSRDSTQVRRALIAEEA